MNETHLLLMRNFCQL